MKSIYLVFQRPQPLGVTSTAFHFVNGAVEVAFERLASRNCEFKIILVNTLSLIKLKFSLVYMVDIVQWFVDRSEQIIITAVGVIVAWIIYKLVKRQINKYYKKEEDKEEQGEQIKKVVKAFYVIALIAIIFSQFSQSLGNIFGALGLVSGTILGFAAMNTIGNALAGLIIMVAKPFQKGDHILFEDKQADVISIKFIFTQLQYRDGTIVSIANQKLLDRPITNFSLSGDSIKRKVIITLDYDTNEDEVFEKLSNTVASVEGVESIPNPSTSVSGLLDYAVEYSCSYWISQVHLMSSIDSKVRYEVLKMCKANDYDLTMPILHHSV